MSGRPYNTNRGGSRNPQRGGRNFNQGATGPSNGSQSADGSQNSWRARRTIGPAPAAQAASSQATSSSASSSSAPRSPSTHPPTSSVPPTQIPTQNSTQPAAPAAASWSTVASTPSAQKPHPVKTTSKAPSLSSSSSSSLSSSSSSSSSTSSSSSSSSSSTPDAYAITAAASLRASSDQIQQVPHRIAHADESWILTGYILSRLAYVLTPIALGYWRIFSGGLEPNHPNYWPTIVKKSADMISNPRKHGYKFAPIGKMHFDTDNYYEDLPQLRYKTGTNEPRDAAYVQDATWAFSLCYMFPPNSRDEAKNPLYCCKSFITMRHEWAHRNSSHQTYDLTPLFSLAKSTLEIILQEEEDQNLNFPLGYLETEESKELLERAASFKLILLQLESTHGPLAFHRGVDSAKIGILSLFIVDYSMVIGFKSYGDVLKGWQTEFEKRVDEQMDQRLADYVQQLISFTEKLDLFTCRLSETEMAQTRHEGLLASHSSSIKSNSADISDMKVAIESLAKKLEESQKKLERNWPKFAPKPQTGLEHWVGRQLELESMKSFFTTRNNLAAYCLLTGAHGLGKTSLAAQYAFTHQQDYKSILWVESHDYESFRSSAINIVRLLRPDLPELTLEVSAVEEFWSVYETEPNVLIILNNLDDEALAGRTDALEVSSAFNSIKKKLKCARGHVIITSIQSTAKLSWLFPSKPPAESALTLTLKQFSDSDARKFFESKIPTIFASNELELIKLAQLVDFFPFALDLAASYLSAYEDEDDVVDAFMNELSNNPLTVLRDVGESGTSFDELIHLAIKSITKKTTAPLELLRLLSCLQSIPVDLSIVETVAALAEEKDPLFASFNETAAKLFRPHETCISRSLLYQDPLSKAFSMHRLVQMALWEDKSFSITDQVKTLKMAATVISKWSQTPRVTAFCAAHTAALSDRILDLQGSYKGLYSLPELVVALSPALYRLMEEKLWISQWPDVLALGEAALRILNTAQASNRFESLHLIKKVVFLAKKAEGKWPTLDQLFDAYEDAKESIGEFHWITFALLAQAIHVSCQTEGSPRGVVKLAGYLESNMDKITNLDGLFQCWTTLCAFFSKSSRDHPELALNAINHAISAAQRKEEIDPILGKSDLFYAQSKKAELLYSNPKTAPEALRLLEPIIQHYSQLLGGNNWEHALNLLHKYEALRSLNDSSRHKYLEQAASICRSNPLLKSKLSYILKTKAFEAETNGDFRAASDLWREAFTVFTESHGGESVYSTKWKISCALSHIVLGELGPADELLNQAYAFSQSRNSKLHPSWWNAYDVADLRYKVASLVAQNASDGKILAAWDKLIREIEHKTSVFNVLFHFEYCLFLCKIRDRSVTTELHRAESRLTFFMRQQPFPCSFLLNWFESLQSIVSKMARRNEPPR